MNSRRANLPNITTVHVVHLTSSVCIYIYIYVEDTCIHVHCKCMSISLTILTVQRTHMYTRACIHA